MPRTTLNIDASVLRELKRLQRREGKSLGQLVSELLVRALAEDRTADSTEPFRWLSQPMRAQVDLDDKDALQSVLDRT
ncbi:MAG TPA: hypothetical protein VG452_02350 [Egibacteraceae bacterium]|nr:hypothetical protein [Actinomycetota bacterium]HWB71030.1 hypothetical protein [Egibacteraceae bacterium]